MQHAVQEKNEQTKNQETITIIKEVTTRILEQLLGRITVDLLTPRIIDFDGN